MDLRIFESRQAVAEHFSNYFAGLAETKKELHVALSGGSTPKIIFDVLASKYSDRIPWERIFFYWGDERCVPPSDEQSNFKMTNDHLLSKIVIPDANVLRIRGENEPADEAKDYASKLESNLPDDNGIPKFDLVILGMGDDGHTASIFPHQVELWHSENYCEVARHPESGQQRITVTGSLINGAEEVVFLVTGSNKADKVREILNREEGYNKYPASLVSPASGRLIWYMDRDAAQYLDSRAI